MIALRLARRPLDPRQADLIRCRSWRVPTLLYALGTAATLPMLYLAVRGHPARSLTHGLAIAIILLIVFIPAAIAYARSPRREPEIVFATYEDERVVTEVELIADTTFVRRRSAAIAWGVCGVLVSLLPLAFSASPKQGFALTVGLIFGIGSLLVKGPSVLFPRPTDFKLQRVALHPAGIIVANPTHSPPLVMNDWEASPRMGTTLKGVTNVHWAADGEEGNSRLSLTDPGLSFTALERIMRYFVANPDQRDVLGSEAGVKVVEALMHGTRPPRF